MKYDNDDRAREVIRLRAQWVDGYVGRALKRAAEGGYEPADRDELEAIAYREWTSHHPALSALLPDADAAR